MLLYADGFEWLGAAGTGHDTVKTRLPERYTENNFGATTYPSAVAGRVDGYGTALRWYSYCGNWQGATFGRLLPQTDVLTIGMGLKAVTATPGYAPLFALKCGADIQMSFWLGPSDQFVAARGCDNEYLETTCYQLGESAGAAIPVGGWCYLEVQVGIDYATGGWVEARVNGETVLDIAGVQTAWKEAAVVDRITWLNPAYVSMDAGDTRVALRGVTWDCYYDDLYICDDSGAANTGFLGDCLVYEKLPTGEGEHTEWTTVYGETDHWEAVNDVGYHDEDATYVDTATVGHRETYTLSASPVSAGTVRGVQVALAARKSGAGSRSVDSLLRLGTTDANSGAALTIGSDYQELLFVHETDPDGEPWTLANVDAMEAGQEVTA